jgi:hypothetical protein
LINKLADLMERDKQILAELECLNNGKPVTIARCVSNLITKGTALTLSTFYSLETPISVIVSGALGTTPVGRTKLSARFVSPA